MKISPSDDDIHRVEEEQMNTVILIILFGHLNRQGGGRAIHHIEFNSAPACEAAKAAMKPDHNHTVSAYCVAKGSAK